MNSPVGREAAGTPAVPDLDTSRPHAARIYDYYLGGKNHFAADRQTRRNDLAALRIGRSSCRPEFFLKDDNSTHSQAYSFRESTHMEPQGAR